MINLMTKEKPYNTLTAYYKYKYKAKVAKIALNADFTCPNRDGTKGYGGCSFCSKLGSGDSAVQSLRQQFERIKSVMERKWPDILYIPYLQAYSNTYAPIERLKAVYEEIIGYYPDKTVGLAIATRADCIEDNTLRYLSELNQRIPIQIELGLQTSNEDCAKRINRCMTNDEFIYCVEKLRRHNLEVVVHIINGLPGEKESDMLNTIRFLNRLDIQGIKIHCLLILKDTALAREYEQKPFRILSLAEYAEITARQITLLKPSVIIHRLAADGISDDVIAPKWSQKKLVVMNEIDKLLRKNKDYQGKNYKDAE